MNGTVYIDILYIFNMALDALAFWATARFMNVRPGLKRLLTAASLGALLSVAVFWPPLHGWQLVFPALGVMAFCLYIIAPRRTAVFYLKSAAVFLLIVFAMAGAALGGKTLLAENSLQSSWKVLAFAVAAAVMTACYGMNRLASRWQRRSFCRTVRIVVNGRQISIDGLIDTGNDLCEPVSGAPAVIAELSSLAGLFPQCVYDVLREYAAGNPAAAISACKDEAWKRRFRLLPYFSIGGSGMLLGFKPDLAIVNAEETIYTDEIVVCVFNKRLASDCGARAIINPAVLRMATSENRKRVS